MTFWRTCQYVLGPYDYASRKAGVDPFCGEATAPGSSYCPDHHKLCWTPRVPKAESARRANVPVTEVTE